MNNHIRSKKSSQDIREITKRSMEDFGETQTLVYMAGLKERMQLLADRPDIGRAFVHTRTEQQYLFFRYESHVIYYRKRKSDIFIVRILHSKMLPEKHL